MGDLFDILSDLESNEPVDNEKLAISEEGKLEEIDLWKKWKKDSDPAALQNLFDRYRGVFTVHHEKMKNYGIPDSVQKAELGKWFIHSLDTYDPNMNAALGTHVWNGLQKAKRINYQYANVAYIPEDSQLKMGTFKSVKSNLEDTLGREPTAAEMGDELGWNINEISRMENLVNMKEDLPENSISVAPWNQTSELQDTLYYLYLELDPAERLVMEHTIGYGGKKLLSADQIARKIKKSVSEVNSIKNKIQTRLRQFQT